MRYRKRQRVDWDEEIRKTERIRRRGLFISALGFGVAVVFIFGVNRMNGLTEVYRKILFALCFVLSMFVLRMTFSRWKRLKDERQEIEREQDREQKRRDAQSTEK